MANNQKTVSQQTHHGRQELCTTRPRYRQGKRLTAVRVYTVNDESCYLLIQGVPAISITKELEILCQRFGSIEELKHIPDYPSSDKFADVYQVKFHTIQSARFAKQKMDDQNFFGGILHVCYAPELETVEETRQKLTHREQEVTYKLNPPHNRKKTHALLSSAPLTNNGLGCAITNTSEERLKGSPESLLVHETTTGTQILKSPSSIKSQLRPIPTVKRIVYHVKHKRIKISNDASTIE